VTIQQTSSASVHAVSTEHALELLKDAGLSGYEAKAYLALLAGGQPMNGYEVAKTSGVPRSTVYETLGKLVARGAAFEVGNDSDSVSYVPLPSEALIGRLRRQTNDTIAGLEQVLPTIGSALTARVVQHLTGRDEVIDRTNDVIESARRTLWLSIWPQEAPAFVPAVQAAVERGVDVFTIAYGDIGAMPGRVFAHSFSPPDVVEERLECRLSIVVADHEQATIAGVMADAVWGMWSDDRAVALLAAEHVRHDIALQLTAERLTAAGLHDFWTNDADLEALRDASALAMGANRPDL
jgi:sugar-specific transcriptional regulator TrmB